ILGAARAMFMELGYAGVSMDGIAARAAPRMAARFPRSLGRPGPLLLALEFSVGELDMPPILYHRVLYLYSVPIHSVNDSVCLVLGVRALSAAVRDPPKAV
ncbi:hypothetical protein BXO6_20500, partial [Xanthomonas oryzae pv. oryzae]